MKLAEHVEYIRQLLDKAFRNRLGRMGITVQWATNHLSNALTSNTLSDCQLPVKDTSVDDLRRIIDILSTFEKETGNIKDAYEKIVEEFTFTLFNRIAAMKVMEAHTLHPEIITRRSQHGDRSFAHFLWLEQNPDERNGENEGLVKFIEHQLTLLSIDIPLFSVHHPYHILPTAIELNGIINAFNKVESDAQVDPEIWKSDDVLGWLYESYNAVKRKELKESKEDIEYFKVRIQSCIYTPRWVVKFLVDNSLGKLYLEMYPDSSIKEKYKIANVPKTQTREIKPLTEIRMIDLATGSGNFVLYGFDLFYDLYIDQIENYRANYNENKLPELIIQNNLYGIDLDDRAVQLAQLGLYIKAKRKKRNAKIDHFNIVSSDFFLPEYKVVQDLFEDNEPLSPELEKIVIDLWSDLQQAYKFGSLIRLEEKFKQRLSGLIQEFEQPQKKIFEKETLTSHELFRDSFFSNLKKAVALNAAKQGITILNTKTRDAITFLQLLTQKYDVAVANPPYTDSADYGTELREFIEHNYKHPFKFNSNLYAAFQKRCFEIIDPKHGKVGMLHPLTFMYISTFKDVRKYILDKTHINILAELGLGGVFANSDVQADVVAYVLENDCHDDESIFLDFKKYKNHTNKPTIFSLAYENLINNFKDGHSYILPQSKLKTIEDSPFIYWISDEFRNKFTYDSLNNNFNIAQGLATSNNDRFVRLWWEIAKKFDQNFNNKKWFNYSKGGAYNKWFGNNWAIVNWENNGLEIRSVKDERGRQRSRTQNEKFYFTKGVTYSASGSKGASFRIHPENSLFDVGGSCIFPTKDFKNIEYLIALLNSKLAFYILDCLNPTVNTQVGDMQRIPFVKPTQKLEFDISNLAFRNIEIKKHLNSFSVIETNFEKSPILFCSDVALRDRIMSYLNYENELLTSVLINEAILDKFIFDVYELNQHDQLQVEEIIGKAVGFLPVLKEAKYAFLTSINNKNEIVKNFIESLPTTNFEEQQIQNLTTEFITLYKGNNSLEEFCIQNQINPINVWHLFQKSKILPKNRAAEIVLEFLVDTFRTILNEDDDGIIPLVGLPEEPRLLDRFEQKCLQLGLNTAQFIQLENLIGSSLAEYVENRFFLVFSDHFKLFKQLPCTPFIWHISSGVNQGFDAYVLIYKWNRDSLFKLKTQYLSKRVVNLEYRLIQLHGSDSAQAQSEKEKIRLQLQEITEFTKKVEELIAEGYDPKLDDGVGKNIAPLQKKGLLKCEVLNKKQLEKYLNADW